MPDYTHVSEEIVATPDEIAGLDSVYQNLQNTFSSGISRSFDWRIRNLRNLQRMVSENYELISQALLADLNQADPTPHLLDVIRETQYMISHLSNLMQSKSVTSEISIVNFPARAELVPEPLGAVLIIGTWNYPFHSSLGPLAGAIAAGNVVVVKPGSLARNSSKLMSELIRKNFDSNAIVCLEGGKEILQPILDMKWDHIMFTGSPQMGRIVMGAAAKHLTGVTLELGGKSPVIVSETADIALAARRVCWSKFASNAGQVCVSCDHMFVHSSVADEFISKLKVMIGEFFPELARSDPNYCRIVTRGHTERLKKIIEIDKGHLIIGGESVVDEKFVAPTVIDFQLDWEAFKSSACMQGEIFGPILPIVRYDTIDQIESFIRSQTRTKPPLAFYIFTSESRASVRNRWINQCPAGAVVVNDCGMHIVEEDLPFGGVGNSGLGAYHGRKSFEIFTHYKPVLWKTRWLDIPFRYPPLTRLRQRAVVFLLWLARHRVTPMRIGKSVLLLAILWRIFT